MRGLSSENSRSGLQDSKLNVSSYLLTTFLLGAFTVLGFAPFYLFPIPVITIALLLYFWRKSATPFQAALLGFCFGMGMFGAGVTWLYVSLHEFGAMPASIAVFFLIILCAYLSLFTTLTGWVLRKLHIETPLMWTLLAATLWALSEWLRGVLFTGFPWLTIGYSQAPSSPLAGFAALVGVYGVSLILIFSAALISLFFEKKLRTWRNVVPLSVIWIIGFGLQHVSWTEPQGEPVTVSVLQGNISQEMKWRPEHVIRTMDTYAKLAHESDSRLIITPEISLPLTRGEVPFNYLAQLFTHAERNNGDILVGMVETSSGGSGDYYNSMFSFGISSEQIYRKHHLVPFGEFIPSKLIFGWVIDVLKIPV